jgi:uncharacterized protein (DUF1015 family)
MVELHPVRAWHPNIRDFDPAKLVSPVYDTLDAVEHRRYAAMQHNAANFTSRMTDTPVATFLEQALGNLRAALAGKAYLRDEEPGLYVYSITYRPERDILEMLAPADRRPEYMLLGLVGALPLDEQPPDTIALHERTFSDRVEERVQLTERTGKHFAPIMVGYNPQSHAVNDLLEDYLGLDRRNLAFDAKVPPLVEVTLYGHTHRLWSIEDAPVIARLQGLLQGERVLILDGHHRFTAAMKLHERGRKVKPLTMLVEAHDKALLLLPWHRYLPPSVLTHEHFRKMAGDAGFAGVKDLPAGDADGKLHEILRHLRTRGERGFIASGRGSAQLVTGSPSDDEGSDYEILHGFLEGRLGLDPESFVFVRSATEAVRLARDGGGVAFIIPPLSLEGVEKGAFAHRFMAQKSTMFQPKVAEGVIFASADGS